MSKSDSYRRLEAQVCGAPFPTRGLPAPQLDRDCRRPQGHEGQHANVYGSTWPQDPAKESARNA